MNERLKQARKTLKLTQVEFAERIGITNPAISQIEKGKSTVTERVIISVCREYGISEEWLRYGIGEMRVVSESDLIRQLSDKHGLEPLDIAILEGYLSLPKSSKTAIREFAQRIALANLPGLAKSDSTSATNEEIANTRSLILEEIDNAPISDIDKMKLLNKTSEIFNKAFPAAVYTSDTGGQVRSKFMGDTVRVFSAAHNYEDGAEASGANEPAFIDIPRDLYNKIRSARPLDEETDKDIL